MERLRSSKQRREPRRGTSPSVLPSESVLSAIDPKIDAELERQHEDALNRAIKELGIEIKLKS